MGEENLRPYLTAAGNSEREILIQRSRFIGRCFPVKTEKRHSAFWQIFAAAIGTLPITAMHIP